MSLKADLHTHLSQFATAPFLFVGSGMSRRYVHSDNWEELLSRFAKEMGREYARYSSAAGGDFPAIASALAEDFHDHWWDDDRYAVSRIAHSAPREKSSPLKIEVAQYVAGLDANLPTTGSLHEELELFRKSLIHGIITTNYDPVLEALFPSFTVFTGQEELLFSDPLGVGEIYKIHGSHTDPESLVLTKKDYERFDERNAYLAAKLLTTFVEHPMIFLGYSLSDPNIQKILKSIAGILTKDNLSKLQDRLLFVQWDGTITTPTMVSSVYPVDGMSIPMSQITVSDYREIFGALSTLKERIPVRLLRRVKEQITELVRTSDPKNKTYVTHLDDSVNIADVDVVIGVGLERQLHLQKQGIVGLDRLDLLRDIVIPELDVSDTETMQLIVERVLPRHVSGRTNSPLFKYLRAAGYLNEDGQLTNDDVSSKLKTRVRLGRSFLGPSSSVKRRAEELARGITNFEGFLEDHSMYEIALALSAIDPNVVEITALREKLKRELTNVDQFMPTDLARAICILDLMENQKE